MNVSLGVLSSASGAASYYSIDDSQIGDAVPSEWLGRGAAALGLVGGVEKAALREQLKGRVAGQQLGAVRDGKIVHSPGWDLTFSAPKSVSIMAHVAGDTRLIEAHTAAVKIALAHVEDHMAATRVWAGSGAVRQSTGNLVIATFRHMTSRALDPQMHTHAVVMNATLGRDGAWRSLHSRVLLCMQREIGALYRQELAYNVAQLGYGIERHKNDSFEITGVPSSAMDALSKRASAMEAWLIARGSSLAEAGGAMTRAAALATRDEKVAVDGNELLRSWQDQVAAAGFGERDREKLVRGARASANTRNADVGRHLLAWRSVVFAAAKLSEREAVFAQASIVREAGRFAFGRLNYRQISAAVERARERGEVIDRTFLDKRGNAFDGFTTPEAVETERTMLRLERAGRASVAPMVGLVDAGRLVERAARSSGRTGFKWTQDQRRATFDLLTTCNRVVGVQGYAGTAKTSTVLAAYANEAERRGFAVTALAPTAAAATVLGEALQMRSDTVARHLLVPEARTGANGLLWLVDEASLLSAGDMAQLLVKAELAGARVALVGDVKQLGSVGAGAAFSQLQQAGMETAKLAEIVRQTNLDTREAVIAVMEGKARRVLAALERGGGAVIDAPTRHERLAVMAQQYVDLSPAERRRALVIEPSRDGRDYLTALIRQELTRRGELSASALTFQALEPKGLTRAELREAGSYSVGDVVVFSRDYAHQPIRRGDALHVIEVKTERNRLTLQNTNGETFEWLPRWAGGGNAFVFETKAMELRSGDKVQFTRNDRPLGRINGHGGLIVSMDTQALRVTLKLENGRRQTLDLANLRDTHLRHSFVHTAHAAQGRTSQVVLVHANSRSENLVDQKMLYVALSRARTKAIVVTDDREGLVRAIYERAGEKQTALDLGQADIANSKNVSAGLG
jgi:conjugative relaxase-like TrwC/TraI family protein